MEQGTSIIAVAEFRDRKSRLFRNLSDKRARAREIEKIHRRKGIINKSRIGSRVQLFQFYFSCRPLPVIWTRRSVLPANGDRCRFVTLRSPIGEFIDFLSRAH